MISTTLWKLSLTLSTTTDPVFTFLYCKDSAVFTGRIKKQIKWASIIIFMQKGDCLERI